MSHSTLPKPRLPEWCEVNVQKPTKLASRYLVPPKYAMRILSFRIPSGTNPLRGWLVQHKVWPEWFHQRWGLDSRNDDYRATIRVLWYLETEFLVKFKWDYFKLKKGLQPFVIRVLARIGIHCKWDRRRVVPAPVPVNSRERRRIRRSNAFGHELSDVVRRTTEISQDRRYLIPQRRQGPPEDPLPDVSSIDIVKESTPCTVCGGVFFRVEDESKFKLPIDPVARMLAIQRAPSEYYRIHAAATSGWYLPAELRTMFPNATLHDCDVAQASWELAHPYRCDCDFGEPLDPLELEILAMYGDG